MFFMLLKSDVKDICCIVKGTYCIHESYLPSLASCGNMASNLELIMEKTRTFQIVYGALTNFCQHSTTDPMRDIMTTEHKQSALSEARFFKHSKTTSSFFVYLLIPYILCLYLLYH